MRVLVFFLLISLFAVSCKNKQDEKNNSLQKTESKPKNTGQNNNDDWREVQSSVVQIDSYDGKRILESGQGFFVAENLVVTLYSLVSQATNVIITPLGSTKKIAAKNYVAVDRINNLVILQLENEMQKPIELYSGIVPNSAKSLYISPDSEKTLQLFTGKVLNLSNYRGTKAYRILTLTRNRNLETPVFVSTKKVFGIAFSATSNFEMQSFVIPSTTISQLLSKKHTQPRTLEELKSGTNAQIAAENSKIKGLVLETDYGNISIRLFNETPAYRDNFIRLTKEGYFDSLLIHRVIKDFGIQSGAADTRYADPEASVGWKGPGYTIPSHIVQELFHKRGMIGSPRKPDTENQRRRSDGSQFYIVSGRKYFDAELDELEEQNDYKFSAAQRHAYKTVGGAPHLDGTYTIFGEVIAGMDVVDKIVQVETDQRWRPKRDIRLKQIRILE